MNIAILASGEGSNAENIIRFFDDSHHNFIVVTNKSKAKVLNRSRILNVKSFIIKDNLKEILQINEIEFVILAGYTQLISKEIIDLYLNKIINIHPSLLPKYGGKGMWGMNVHKEVISNKEKESGITIHYVSENYDEGKIIEQHKCDVLLCDNPETLAKKISLLEREYFPKCIERLLTIL